MKHTVCNGIINVTAVLNRGALHRVFYSRNTSIVARELLGCFLVKEDGDCIIAGKIVETEAYFGNNDPASHSYCGITPRNSVMFGAPGFSYVYFVYGNHYLLNVVTEKKGVAGAVLIRGIEPYAGIEIMKRNRRNVSVKELTNGPGKLTKAFGIDLRYNKTDITKGSLFIAGRDEKNCEIASTKRIGINKGKDLELRYFIKGNPFVSKG